MSFDQTDEEIISIYKNGDREVFKKLIDKYTQPLFNFIAHLDRENASDILQEVFIKVWKNIKKFDEKKSSFKTWIFIIAKNTAFDFLRKRKNILFSDLEKEEGLENFSESVPDEAILPDEVLSKIEDSEYLNKILNQLPAHYKMILIFHYQDEMTFDEIGKILNKPLNTVKSYHHRAILELRKMIK